MKKKVKSSAPLILSIDTSCDETSAAVTSGRVVLANVVASQAEIHRPYGGVFPDLAKRAHQDNIKPVIQTTLKRAGLEWDQIGAIAVTVGPGLAPALEIGINYVQKLAKNYQKPVIPVNHIEAHLLSVLASRNKKKFKNNKPPTWQLDQFNQQYSFPVLGLVVSGGHTEFVQINQIGQYQILGQTIDDAAGEALDKVGRMVNLGYPAGPVIEKLAKQGNSDRFDFPLPMTTKKNYNLSYSGLKTAALRKVRKLEAENKLDQQTIKDFAASFQQIVFKHLNYKLEKLLIAYQKKQKLEFFQELWLGGGVAANINLRSSLRKTLRAFKIDLKTPFEKRLCGDNAAMIGVVASFKYQQKLFAATKKINRRPNWSVESAWSDETTW